MRPGIVGALLGLFVIAGVDARQAKPDFSGRWALVEQDAPASIPRELVVSLVRREIPANVALLTDPPSSLSVTRHLATGVETQTYLVGGTSVRFSGVFRPGDGAPFNQASSTRFAAKWEGDLLALGTGTFVGEESTGERYEVWSLADGILSITIGEKSSANPVMKPVTFRYRRAAGLPEPSS